MLAHRERKKKLIVAFHFQFSHPAGWDCDVCRKTGLDKKRRCAWLDMAVTAQAAPVWVRKKAGTTACPKSVVTGQSMAFLEEYLMWRKFGRGAYEQLEAKKADAFVILDAEFEAEENDVRQQAARSY